MPFDTSIIGKPFGPRDFTYDWRKPALHALACGASETDLDLLLDSRGPKVLRSFPVVMAFEPLVEALGALGGNPLTLVHGAQRCTVHRALPGEATVQVTARVTALYDKGKAALAIYQVKGEHGGSELFELEHQIFYRGEGGFGGDRGPEAPSYAPPAGSKPDHHLELKTSPTQALLYRLASGDTNPIHSDPEVAAMAGFPRPILHGLCTFGFTELALERALTGGDPDRVTNIEGRFSKPVFPGETIGVDIYRVSDSEAYYTATIVERNEPAITLGRVTYR
jgi:acyl dehydratase